MTGVNLWSVRRTAPTYWTVYREAWSGRREVVTAREHSTALAVADRMARRGRVGG